MLGLQFRLGVYAQTLQKIFKHEAKLISSNLSTTYRFGEGGIAISKDGSRVAISSQFDGTSSNGGGSVEVFRRSDNTWVFEQKLTGLDTTVGDQYGYSVDIDDRGEKIVVGARRFGSTVAGHGKVYIWNRSGTTWTQWQTLIPPVLSAYEEFGSNVKISGNGSYIVVGSGENINTNEYLDNGSLYTYYLSINTWWPGHKVNSPHYQHYLYFSVGLSLNYAGDELIVSASNNNFPSTGNGIVYSYTRSLLTWTISQTLATGPNANDRLGASVALSSSGNRVVIGIPELDNGISNSGGAVTMVKSNGVWGHEQYLLASDRGIDNYGGERVDISDDGTTIIVSSRHEMGAIYVWKLIGTTWINVDKLLAIDRATGDAYGTRIALSGDGIRIAGSAPYNDHNSLVNPGSVYIHNNILA